MPKRHYLLALACYLAIPVAMIAGAGLFNLIDPEMARSHADYVRDYRLLELARRGVLMASAALAAVLWAATCFLVIKARQRSLGWLALAAAGPPGFSIIAMLEDHSPAPSDAYQRFIGTLKIYWRVALEIAVFVAVWFLAFGSMLLTRELMIRYESLTTGTPVATIIDRQNASSGMWAFSEGLEVLYLVVLIYLLWPIVFNLAGRLLGPRAGTTRDAQT
ncbi:MAG: hypothetical protein NTW45_01795 [Rhodocyclales bacterium]|nr:hypothetical protein [Rhodocyclales bacterium]